MKLTFFGHSAFQIETAGSTILVDPFISDNPHTEGLITADDLQPDVILLTHAHGDHWGDTPDLAARTGAQVVGSFEITSYLASKHGHDNGHGMNTGGSAEFDWGRATMTWARHSSSFPDGTYGGVAAGYILEIEGTTIYAAGDTDRFAEMEWYGQEHSIDIALLPVGDNFTMGPLEAARAARMLKAGLVVPVHWGTFPPLTGDPDEFSQRIEDQGGRARKMAPGEVLDV